MLFKTTLALGAMATAAQAGGIVQMVEQGIEAVIDSASSLSGQGQFKITNVATGQVLSFSRDGGTTNFYPQDGGDSVEIQFDGLAARISGGNNKCASAQWSYEVEGGVDYAAVSYACAVGNGQSGTATLEKTKQWWYFVPAGSSSDDTPAPAPSTTEEQQQEKPTVAAVAEVKVAETPSPSPSPSPSPAPAPAPAPAADKVLRVAAAAQPVAESPSSSAAEAESTPAAAASAPKTQSSLLTKPKGYYETSKSSIGLHEVDTSKVVKSDRKTWICKHPGWWLNNHPGYVAAGHVECADDLAAYRAEHSKKSKRATHHDMAKHQLYRRGPQTFYIIAQDHIYDMATRAISSSSLDTYGGYQSTTLALWNKGDKNQMWTITPA